MSPVIWIVVGLLSAAAVLTIARIIRGPTQADRVVAAELLTGLTVALVTLGGWHQWGIHALDVAIGLALVGFMGSVGLAVTLAPREREP